MNRMINSVKKIFDRKQHLISHYVGRCTISETDPQATMTQLVVNTVSGTPDIYSFDSSYIKGMSHITCDRSSRLKDSNCDGVLFVKTNDEVMHIVMAELKSSYPNASTLNVAYQQLIYTYLKYRALFSISKDGDIDAYSLNLVLACSCPTDNRDIEAAIMADEEMDRLSGIPKLAKKDFLQGIFGDLYRSPSKRITLKFSDLNLFSGLTLNDSLSNKEFELSLVTSTKANMSQATMTLNY